MRCPFCGHSDSHVKDSRPTEDNTAIRRRRACPDCGARWTTFERVQLRDLVVIKSNGQRAPFDRDKLETSMRIALRKRPVSAEQIDQIVSGIARKLESSGEIEVASQDIGELAMESLRVVDPVGYVRYASVYRDFDAPSDFAAFIKQSELDED